ncbi:hypothetical protein B0A52_01884 [Exophiala mesophila]|uniref:Uncharacterized protein n=1 Tax=Exophiala mesophila TaxID=212818 RepID=A0A438NE97_EXOME|nr:hypothetical protein B0A52_01884 [Exophiala mesophila]
MSHPANQFYDALPDQVCQSTTGIIVHYTIEYGCGWLTDIMVAFVTWMSVVITLFIIGYVGIIISKIVRALLIVAAHIITTMAVTLIQIMQVVMAIVPLFLFVMAATHISGEAQSSR